MTGTRSALGRFRDHLLAIEQPVHPRPGLEREAGRQLCAWPGRPPLIIDESDGAVGDVNRALELGYAGTAKNLAASSRAGPGRVAGPSPPAGRTGLQTGETSAISARSLACRTGDDGVVGHRTRRTQRTTTIAV
jgi:hypothetical protein